MKCVVSHYHVNNINQRQKVQGQVIIITRVTPFFFPFLLSILANAICHLYMSHWLQHHYKILILLTNFINLQIYDDHKDLLTNETVKKILGLRGFFHDVTFLTSVLSSLKTAILYLESSNTNLADCFIQLIKLTVSINNIPSEEGMIGFRNHCIDVINKR